MSGEGRQIVEAYIASHPGSHLNLRQEPTDSIWPECWIGNLYTNGKTVCGALGRTQMEAIEGIAFELGNLEPLAQEPPDDARAR